MRPERTTRGELVNTLGALDGERIPGGCDSCDAFQTVEAERAGVWHLTVHHDPECPLLKAKQGRT